jgi:hypothetical protein
MELWTALYMPKYDGPDPSKYDLLSEKAARKFIFQKMCKGCREERRKALLHLDWDNNYPPSEYPACSEEWNVLRTEELEKCESLSDILSAAGWTKVYPKDLDSPTDGL